MLETLAWVALVLALCAVGLSVARSNRDATVSQVRLLAAADEARQAVTAISALVEEDAARTREVLDRMVLDDKSSEGGIKPVASERPESRSAKSVDDGLALGETQITLGLGGGAVGVGAIVSTVAATSYVRFAALKAVSHVYGSARGKDRFRVTPPVSLVTPIILCVSHSDWESAIAKHGLIDQEFGARGKALFDYAWPLQGEALISGASDHLWTCYVDRRPDEDDDIDREYRELMRH